MGIHRIMIICPDIWSMWYITWYIPRLSSCTHQNCWKYLNREVIHFLVYVVLYVVQLSVSLERFYVINYDCWFLFHHHNFHLHHNIILLPFFTIITIGVFVFVTITSTLIIAIGVEPMRNALRGSGGCVKQLLVKRGVWVMNNKMKYSLQPTMMKISEWVSSASYPSVHIKIADSYGCLTTRKKRALDYHRPIPNLGDLVRDICHKPKTGSDVCRKTNHP